jgi:hypothetical protein
MRCAEHKCAKVQTGIFGADMMVTLLIDGPVTIKSRPTIDSRQIAPHIDVGSAARLNSSAPTGY